MVWTANLAYAVGLITSDGSLSKDGRHIDFTSNDIEQIDNFKKILNLKNKMSPKYSDSEHTRFSYHVQFGNIKFYRFLTSIGLMPNKSKVLGELLVPDKYFADFLRGCFDGDGSSYSYWDIRWRSSYLLYLSITSASIRFLRWLQKKLNTLYNVGGAINQSTRSFQLRFAKKDSLIIASKMYYSEAIPFLWRKRFKIEEALGIIRSQKFARVAEWYTRTPKERVE